MSHYGLEKLAQIYDPIRPLDEFAPGIPKKERVISPGKMRPGITRMVVQEHQARRAGKHYDFRLKDGQNAHSWAVPDLPSAGKGILGFKIGDIDQKTKVPAGTKVLAIQSPTHTVKYMDYEGEIGRGYGAGRVTRAADKPVDVISATDNQVKLYIPGAGQYALIRLRGSRNWLLNKMHDPEGSITFKPKYKEQNIDNIDIKNPNTVLEAKIDGAHSVVELGKHNQIYSYRVSKKTGKPVDHTHQMPDIRDAKTPSELYGTKIRTEVFARKGNKVIPPNEIGALLNSGVIKSRIRQNLQKTKLKPMLIDIEEFKGESFANKPYRDKLVAMQEIQKKMPIFELPEIAVTPLQKQKLLSEIKAGKHFATKEGVIEWDLNRAVPIKSKVRPERDVYVRKITPDLRGFHYSFGPQGKIMGRVGTGFTHQLHREMQESPELFKGMVARVQSEREFPSGALRVPVFKTWHLEKGLGRAVSS